MEIFKSIVGVIIMILWMFGGVAGVIWAAINESLLDVVLCFVVPFYGLGYFLLHLVGAL